VQAGQTQFEAPRGVSEIEVRHGFAQVHFSLGGQELAVKRLEVLRVIAEAGISHKYLQLTQNGLAFIITEAQVPEMESVLREASIAFELNKGRSMVLVKSIGLWEEEGTIASIVEAAIASGVQVDHVGDMHDRMYMVVKGEVAEDTAAKFREHLTGRKK
jgi:aspartokinase